MGRSGSIGIGRPGWVRPGPICRRSACRTPPRVPRVVGQAVRCERDHLLMAELLGGHLEVAFVAEVASVVVLVAASKGKRLDMVDDGRELHAVTSLAQLAEAGRSGHAPLTLTLPSPTAEALGGHITASRYEESRNHFGRGSNNW